MVNNIQRDLFGLLHKRLAQYPAVVLLGARQVGKTTLARAFAAKSGRKAVYLDLELPSDRAKLSDPELYFARHHDRLMVLDEVHRVPRLFETLRGIVDQRRHQHKRTGHFLLLGSASLDLLQQTSETLAGRVALLELNPFSVAEVAGRDGEPDALDRLWLRGGFPDSYLAPSETSSMSWRMDFIRTYLERDVPMFGPRVPAELLRRFWQMLANNQGQMLNAARLAASLGVGGHTIARYLDLLVDLLLVRRLPPWSANAGKRLVKTPKVYVRDAGLVHALLGIDSMDALLGHPVAGSSWEGLMLEHVMAVMPAAARATFYRTSNGAELDLVVELGRERWAIEVKRSLNPTPTAGFFNACDDVQATRRIVVYPGSETFPLRAGAEAMPLTALLRRLDRMGRSAQL